MQETPMLFQMAPPEFWKQIKSTIEEVVKANSNQTALEQPTDHLPEKALLKLSNVCAVFQVSKPTLYDWLRQNKIKSFKIKSRRYFLRTDIEAMIRQHQNVATATKPTDHLKREYNMCRGQQG